MASAINYQTSYRPRRPGILAEFMFQCLLNAALLFMVMGYPIMAVAVDEDIRVEDEIGDTPLNVPEADPSIEIDDIDPDTTELEGDRLQQAVEAALREIVGVDVGDVEVQVHGGTVTLDGMVDSWTGVAAAGNVARKVEGVRRVTNLLRAPLSAGQSDAEIKAAIENAFARDGLLETNTIVVVVTDGYVTLTGDVDTIATKKRAVYRARVGGVEDVDATQLNVMR